MKLYMHPASSSARRVTLTLAHLGIEVEHRVIDLANASDREALAAVNPNRKIPVLVDAANGVTLWESHAIAQYLCDGAGARGAELYPTERAARADVHRWTYWVGAHLGPSIGPISFERLWKKLVQPGVPPDEAVIARHERFLAQTLAVLDAHVAARTWVSGKGVTIADYSIAATMMYREVTQLSLDAFPHVQAYLARVAELPAWKSTEPQKLG